MKMIKDLQKSLEALDEGFEDGFTYLTQDNIHSRLRTTNCLKELNEEIRRRERVVRIFPNDSAIKAYWINTNRYQ